MRLDRSEAILSVMDLESRTVQVNGLGIAYRRAGRGAPLLLLHGGFSDSREWGPQLSGLSDSYDVIAMDCLGCGASDEPPPGFQLSDYADVAAGFLHALGIGRAHVGGVSFGSMYALVIYRRHPGTVRSLLLVSAYAGWAGSLPPDEVERRVRWAEGAFSTPVEEWGPEFVRTVYSDAAPHALLEEAMRTLRDARPAAFAPVARAFFPADLRDVLPRIDVPTLLVSGGSDRRSGVSVAAALQAQIVGARLAVVPGAGHGVNGEAPEEFNRAVREFLERVPT